MILIHWITIELCRLSSCFMVFLPCRHKNPIAPRTYIIIELLNNCKGIHFNDLSSPSLVDITVKLLDEASFMMIRLDSNLWREKNIISLTLFIHSFIHSFLCMYECMCAVACRERSENNRGVSCLLLPCGVWRLGSGCQAPLLDEPSPQLSEFLSDVYFPKFLNLLALTDL